MPPVLDALNRKPDEPTSRLAMDLAERTQDIYGMDPDAHRLGILPYPAGALGGGPIDWTDWTAPQFVYDMAQSSVLPGHVAQGGQWTPEQATQMAMDLGGTGSVVGVAPVGSLGIFAGRRSRTADVGKLKRAERMRDAGANRDDIWNETGWFQDVDGKWKYEIDDSAMRLTSPDPVDQTGWGVAGERSALQHPELAEAYPEFAGMQHKISGAGSGGEFISPLPYGGIHESPAQLVARGVDPAKRRSTALHEMQHATQGQEGFAHGGDPAYFSGQSPRDQYRRLAGEAESRNVQARADFTPEQRQATAPWQTLDVPEDELIVRTMGVR